MHFKKQKMGFQFQLLCLLLSLCFVGEANVRRLFKPQSHVKIKPKGQTNDCLINSTQYPCRIDIAYGTDQRQKYDLWLPPQLAPHQKVPVVVYFHGGGYFTGDKSDAYKKFLRMNEYLDAGIAFMTVNYRLSGDFPYRKGETGEHPPAMIDGARALQHLRANALQWGIDPSKVAVTGGSAGGGISLWLTFHDDLAQPGSSNKILRQSTRVSCAAVAETQTSLDIGEVEQLLGPNYVVAGGLPGIYGVTPEQYSARPAHYQRILASSFFEASPISHVSEDDDAKVLLTYSLPLGGGNIHGPEFGVYLANNSPKKLAKNYKRNSLDRAGISYHLELSGSFMKNQKLIQDFLIRDCF
jgi:hypothetical protein